MCIIRIRIIIINFRYVQMKTNTVQKLAKSLQVFDRLQEMSWLAKESAPCANSLLLYTVKQ